MIADLVHEVLADARRAVRRRVDAGELYAGRREALDFAIASTAADLAFERMPQLQERIGRERLIEIITSEIGD